MTVLVTGCGGFIGFHTCNDLLKKRYNVVGIDNVNDYYDTNLKKDRIKILKKNQGFIFKRLDLADLKIEKIFNEYKIKIVINLAAQAGVRYASKDPMSYIHSNLVGFFNLINLSKIYKVEKFIYASSSSVYGNSKKDKFSENDSTDHPIQLYAATKKSNEIIAHSYSHQFKLQTIGLRFFTVYGPFGRPDMALFNFTKNIYNNKKINIYGEGKHKRDFTYIDDVVSGITACINIKMKDKVPFKIYNLGRGKKRKLIDFIKLIEKYTNKKAKKSYLPLQSGDIYETSCDISKAQKELKYNPKTDIESGVKNFIKWFVDYYSINS